jgi:hypothetical protein
MVIITCAFSFLSLQLSELEQRVIEAEERADDAEDKVSVFLLGIPINRVHFLLAFFVRKFSAGKF